MGFDGGRVLEPGCGTGLFFALRPQALVGKLAPTGVEINPTDARIAKLLDPNAAFATRISSKTKLPELFDLAIGNPPFSPTAPSAPTIRPASCACPCMTTSSPARSSGCAQAVSPPS